MLNPGQNITAVNGERILVQDYISTGGQGRTYKGKLIRSNDDIIVKEFFDKFHTAETVKRQAYLVNKALYRLSPIICAPFNFINNGIIGNISCFAKGIPLREFLELGNPNLLENLQLAIVLASGIDALHRINIAHGDIHPDNFLVIREGSVIKTHIIDFDNFSAPGQPPPPMSGQQHYIAPEIRQAHYERGCHFPPNIYTDRYSLGLVLHEIILLTHNYRGVIDDDIALYEVQKLGKWLQDPAINNCTDKDGGFKSEILTTELSRLFRRAFVLDPSERPSASEWFRALMEAFKRVQYCKFCDYQFINDIDKLYCPDCGVRCPDLILTAEGGIRIPLDSGRVIVGRDNLNGSKRVSSTHAVFRKEGFQTYIIPTGRNGTYRYSSAKNEWIRLSDGEPVLVQDGDILCFADFTVWIQSEV